MKTLEEFKSYLLHSKKKHSKATIKNYIADINKFIKWAPSKITPETIELYKLKLNKIKRQSIINSHYPCVQLILQKQSIT